MALPGGKIRKNQAQRLKKQKFNPLAPGIKNKYQFRKATERRAEGTIRPKLAAVGKLGMEEGQAHKGRVGDLQSMYGYLQNHVGEAYQKAQDALNQVLSTTVSGNQAAQSNFLAALEQSRAADRDQATTIGGVVPEGLGDDVAAMASGAGNSAVANLAQIQSGTATRAADRIGTTALGRTRALESEMGRHRAGQKVRGKERLDILKEVPTAREEARKDILDEELARASERERQKIARQSLKLEKRQTKETERSNKAQEAISWAGIRTERQRIQQEVDDEVKGAKSEAQREAAEARGEAYNRGVEVFERYFDNTKRKSWNPQTLYRNLTLVVPPEVALSIMSHGPGHFQQFVAKRKGKGSGSKSKWKGDRRPFPKGPEDR